MELDDAREGIITLLVDQVAAYVIVLFGSYGKGLSREDSDIDIAYLGDKELGSYEIFMVAQNIAIIMGRDVDLLDLRAVSTVMKAQIITSGQVIYSSDEVRRVDYFVKSLKEYALLNEERAVVMNEIERRGSIYGK